MRPIWDEGLGDWRAPNEAEIRSWVETRGLLERSVDAYLEIREGLDYDYHHCWNISGGAEAEFTDSSVILTLADHDRYGDREEHRLEFPIEHLWASDVEAAIRADIAAREERDRQAKLKAEQEAQQRREAAERKAEIDKERDERATLARLIAKYKVKTP